MDKEDIWLLKAVFIGSVKGVMEVWNGSCESLMRRRKAKRKGIR